MIFTFDPVEFLWENCPYLHKENTKEKLAQAILKHLEYRTIVFTSDENGLRGVCRFNVEEVEAEILDVAIREDLRGKDELVHLLKLGLALWVNVKQLRFNSIDKGREFVTPVSLILNKEK